MIINEPACDWLTLTTFQRRFADYLMEVVETGSTGLLRDERRMQYVGLRNGGLFVGSAIQNERTHYMFQASGEAAALAMPTVAWHPLKCTRIDLQATIPLPAGWYHRDLYRQLKADKPERNISIVESGDGLDTIYVGKRSSRRFTRFYIKPGAKGEPYLRYEVEYKAELANHVWQLNRVSTNREALMGGILLGELQEVVGDSWTCHELLELLQAYDAGMKPKGERAATSGRTLRWLQLQVDPAIQRAMHDHDEGHAIRDLVRAWAAEADMIDESGLMP